MTNALTLEDFDNPKIKALKPFLTAETLDLINKSELFKRQIKFYLENNNSSDVIVDSKNPGGAFYQPPYDGTRGFAAFGADRLSTPQGFFEVVSHEFGHGEVESLGGSIELAKRAAAKAGEVGDYVAACLLTEGYGRLAFARAVDDLVRNSPPSQTLAKLTGTPEYTQYAAMLKDPALAAMSPRDQTLALAYRWLRDTDNRYYVDVARTLWIDFSANQVKIGNNDHSTLIGTDGNDSFDSNWRRFPSRAAERCRRPSRRSRPMRSMTRSEVPSSP